MEMFSPVWICVCAIIAGSAILGFLYQTFALRRRGRELQQQTLRVQALADINNTMHYIDLRQDSWEELKADERVQPFLKNSPKASEMMRDVISRATRPEDVDLALQFTDLNTIAERMKNVRTISGEFRGIHFWYRARFVVVERDEEGLPVSLFLATVIVQDEKKREEGLIGISLTDSLTGLGNHRAMEEALNRYRSGTDPELTLFSMDLNGLKTVNDSLGHRVGDVLIQSATTCIVKAFGEYGEIFRTGGDEFVVLLRGGEDVIGQAVGKLEVELGIWQSDQIRGISMSYGYVRRSEFPEKSLEELLAVADDRMYQMKKEYYNQPGHDRRKR